ncbi:MAG: DNA/RNA nuclease SfsA [Deltaproteobacteria bacterium]|nr:DNA/RNA nuclease SfsA [Deltaproteobacteria bacterium]
MPRNQIYPTATLKWPKLIEGTLIKRYKRFMADVKLRNHHVVTAHCPNSGSMKTCCETGRKIYLSRHNKPSRRLKYTWEMIQMEDSLVGVNTMVPNRLTEAAVSAGDIPELAGYETIRREVKYGENSRIDLLLEKGGNRCFVEVKNCTLVEGGLACFPDAVTSRGLKHLIELQKEVEKGHRSVMFYLIQRMDADRFEPADHIDQAYGKELRKAVLNGVEVLVYDVAMDLEGIRLNGPVPFHLQPGTGA